MANGARFFCVFGSIIFMLSLIYYIAWLYVAVGSLTANLGVRLDTATLDSFKITNTTKLTAELNLKLHILKPNHGLRVSYNASNAQVFYMDHHDIIFLNTSTLQSFFNSTSSMVHMSLKVDIYVAKGLDLSRISHETLEFGITLSTSFSYKSHFFLFLDSSESVKLSLRFAVSPGFPLEGTCTEPPLGLE
jgi:hypothetical protein